MVEIVLEIRHIEEVKIPSSVHVLLIKQGRFSL